MYKPLHLSKEEFNALPKETILFCSALGNELYTTAFSDFTLCREEIRDITAYYLSKNIPYTEEDAKGNFSNLFILEVCWNDKQLNGNNAECIIFFEGRFWTLSLKD